MATDLGKVGIVAKGTYNSSNTYEALDAVTYNNSFYIAKKEVPANTAPTDTTYWQPALARNLTNINQTNYSFSAQTTLSATGLSIEIPANSNFSIMVNLIFVNSSPQEVAISTSNSSLNERNTVYRSETAFASFSGRTGSSAATFYVWAKYNVAASNFLYYSGWYETT